MASTCKVCKTLRDRIVQSIHGAVCEDCLRQAFDFHGYSAHVEGDSTTAPTLMDGDSRSPGLRAAETADLLLCFHRSDSAKAVLSRAAQEAISAGYLLSARLLCADLVRIDHSAAARALDRELQNLLGENFLAPPLLVGDERREKIQVAIEKLAKIEHRGARVQLATLYRRLGDGERAKEVLLRNIAELERVVGRSSENLSDVTELAMDYSQIGEAKKSADLWVVSSIGRLRTGHATAAAAEVDIPRVLELPVAETARSHIVRALALHDPFMSQFDSATREFERAIPLLDAGDGLLRPLLTGVLNARSPAAADVAINQIRHHLGVPPENDGALRPRCVSCGGESKPISRSGLGLCATCTIRLGRIAVETLGTVFVDRLRET